MNQAALLNLLESVLGKGRKTGKGNYSFKCPFCSHHKNKLEVQLQTDEKGQNPYACWVCGVKGLKVTTLLKKIKASTNKIDEAKLITKTGTKREYKVPDTLSLPKEFISLTDDIEGAHNKIIAKHAINFLTKRGVTQQDIVKYNIGFCSEGNYSKRIIIPSYDEVGQLNYFIARTFEDAFEKYKNPPVSAKDAIGFELYINWDAPIILCEGVFDAITLKRNVIPLNGKQIHDKLMAKLAKSSVNRIYVVLDKDAIKDAIKHCEKLLSHGKEVYLVALEGKDPNELGAKKMLNLLEEAVPLSFGALMLKKLEII